VENNHQADAMINFLKEKVLRNPRIGIDEDTALVSSGILDSFALIDVLLELERVTKRRISASRVSPADLDTVGKMLSTAERVGTSR
jgi:acyl carrier protein